MPIDPRTAGQFGAIVVENNGHDVARGLRTRSRHVPRGGVRFVLLNFAASVLDEAADRPKETAAVIEAVVRERQRRRAQEADSQVRWV